MEKKFALKSKTVWGAIVMIVGMLAPMFGWDWWQAMQDQIGTMFQLGWQFVAAGLVLWGRFTADKKITVSPNSD